MLTITNLGLKTKENILENASYTFKPGNMYGIVARNGMGKTTLFRALNDLTTYSGSIQYDNRPITKARQDVFYFENETWLDYNLTGLDHLLFVKSAWHSDISLDDILNYWEMHPYINRPIKTYSLGMKQKLLIALYQISDAKYLIMDEISNGLDENSRDKLFSLLNSLKQNNKLIIASSHYKEDLSKSCDFLITFSNRKLVSTS